MRLVENFAPTAASETGSTSASSGATDDSRTPETSEEHKRENSSVQPAQRTDPQREAAGRLIQHIGAEFTRLRKTGRSGAWASLEDLLMTNAHVLIDAGMLSPKDWIGMSIDIEQFRKAEGGSLDSAGDMLAKWLSESDTPVKRDKKVKVLQ